MISLSIESFNLPFQFFFFLLPRLYHFTITIDNIPSEFETSAGNKLDRSQARYIPPLRSQKNRSQSIRSETSLEKTSNRNIRSSPRSRTPAALGQPLLKHSISFRNDETLGAREAKGRRERERERCQREPDEIRDSREP